MRLTILGSSGSVPAPGNPASGYLLNSPDAPAVIMDMGPGVLAALQGIQDPADAHVIFSHLHTDHCADFASLLVWRRFHPVQAAKSRNLLFGPEDTPNRLGRLSSDEPDGIDDMSDTFAFDAWQERKSELVDNFTITPFRVVHPIETYALRVEEHRTGATLTFSGDSAYTEALVDAAKDVDVFLCEASWGDSCDGKAPAMHMCGQDAGKIAAKANVKKLVITHIPPWIDAQATVAAAAEYYTGPIEVAVPGMQISF
ncbi:MBL fold metallo-hydrolase [Corynebacterium crudilactis]|uniref:Metallo-beta-lactamase domain-containing protein n=1 Tax=Corynebacterium crudilactis TaxID=1652495 RepID=A0A172QVR4_9CORY|nr:MBL fold metallo-hydrolase [Corynebacterium crudilactis]ANE04720.1 hypothetical protein ccrud_11265 [Corynebacterium crudilactis]